ncbi:hypothetical protein U27_05384 [Candidatus Vecturithrix granuli]|uniref:Uncharacterized protein n=1 Tax=Vecturithrix granuli TaxID=1499967 RepID=A0A081C1F5_VECG1|nr:hypothetical protein U27_05384 [Candidatus Vecturithrix granuli]
MRLAYLINDSEQSLSPFFSKRMLSILFNSVLIVCGVLLLFWPWKNLVSFISQQKIPLTFFHVCTTTLVILAYIHLRCGGGEIMKGNYYASTYSKEVSSLAMEQNFFKYGLVEFAAYVILLLLPFLPLLILAASVSVIPLLHFLNACAIVLATSFLCRVFGFFIYLVRGRFSSLGYFCSRIFLALYLFATITLAPAINPILNIYRFNKNLQNIGFFVENALLFYVTTLGASSVFIALNYFLIRRHLRKSGSE